MKYISFIFCLMLFVACGDEQGKTNSSENSNSEISLGDTCDCNELVIDSLGNHLLNDKAFTGICVSNYEGTDSKYLEKNLLNGRLHGKVEYYDREGQMILQEFYEDGNQKRSGGSDGATTCDCSELETQEVQGMSVYKLDNVPFTGKCEKFYDGEKQVYMESNYKKGLLHGYTVYYNRDGSTILMEKYENGEVVSAIH